MQNEGRFILEFRKKQMNNHFWYTTCISKSLMNKGRLKDFFFEIITFVLTTFLTIEVSAVETTGNKSKRSGESDIFYSREFKDKMSNPPNIFPKKGEFKSIKGQFPAVVQIWNNVRNEKGILQGFGCSAVFIKSDKVLTAAHCFRENRIEYTVVVTDEAKILNVKSVEWLKKAEGYPAFDLDFLNQLGINYAENDLALVSLEDVQLEQPVYKIYPKNPKQLIGKKIKIIGFPSIYQDPQNSYDASNKFSTDEVCEITAYARGTLFSNCAQTSGLSGGPAIYVDEKGNEWVVGVLSSHVLIKSLGIYGLRIAPVYDHDWLTKALK